MGQRDGQKSEKTEEGRERVEERGGGKGRSFKLSLAKKKNKQPKRKINKCILV